MKKRYDDLGWQFEKNVQFYSHSIKQIGSDALSGKMLLKRIVEMIKLRLILGQNRLSKYELCPAGLGKELGQYPPTGARNRKKTTLQIIFNNPRSSIKPGSAPDPTN